MRSPGGGTDRVRATAEAGEATVVADEFHRLEEGRGDRLPGDGEAAEHEEVAGLLPEAGRDGSQSALDGGGVPVVDRFEGDSCGFECSGSGLGPRSIRLTEELIGGRGGEVRREEEVDERGDLGQQFDAFTDERGEFGDEHAVEGARHLGREGAFELAGEDLGQFVLGHGTHVHAVHPLQLLGVEDGRVDDQNP